MVSDINNSKLVGGKRKNGHKSDCSCHICENMKNKARRGGYEEEVEKKKEYLAGGSKKKNGHRKACRCPICKNMKNSKKRGGSNSSRRTKKRRGGDDKDNEHDENLEDNEPYENLEDNKPYENLEDNKPDENLGDNEPDKNLEYETHDDIDGSDEEEEQEGGRKKKRGNGHKANCKCPICKNMRKKKGGEQPDIENQIGDIEEGGIKATIDSDLIKNETPASDSDYNSLDAAEKGQAGLNVVGGTRKRRRGRKTRKARRTRRSH